MYKPNYRSFWRLGSYGALLGFLLFTTTILSAQRATNNGFHMNVAIGSFVAAGTGDWQGTIALVGSSEYVIDNVAANDVLFDENGKKFVVLVKSVIVAGYSVLIDVDELDAAGRPLSGRGALMRPTANMELLLPPANGSNFFSEETESKMLIDNFIEIDAAGGGIPGTPGGDGDLTIWDAGELGSITKDQYVWIQGLSYGRGLAGRMTYFVNDSTIEETIITYSSTLMNASSITGALGLPTGTTAERGAATLGFFRANSTLGDIEFGNGTIYRSVVESMFGTGTSGEIAYFNTAGVLSDTTPAGILSMIAGLSGTGVAPRIPVYDGTSTFTNYANFLYSGTSLSVATTNSTYPLEVGTGGMRFAPQSADPPGTGGVKFFDSDDNWFKGYNGTQFWFFARSDDVDPGAGRIWFQNSANTAQTTSSVAQIVNSEVRLGGAATVDKGAYEVQLTGSLFIGGPSTNPNFTYPGYGNNLNSTFSLQTAGTFTSSEALYATNNAASSGVAEFVATSGSANLRLENSSSSAGTAAIIASHPATGTHTILRADTRNSWSHCCGQANQDNVWDFNFEAYRSGSGWSVQGQSNAAKIRVGNLGGVYLATNDYDAYFDFQVRKDSVLTTGLFVSGGDATGIGGMFGVGIFDSTPSATLDVAGNARIQTIPEGTPSYMSVSAESDHDIVRREFAYGEMHIQDTSPGTVAITAGSPVECSGWASLVATNFTFAAGRLTYTGTETARFLLDASMSVTHDVSGSQVKAWLYYNNSKQQKTGSYTEIPTAGTYHVVNPKGTLILATNDYIEIFLDSDATGNVDVIQANLTITKL